MSWADWLDIPVLQAISKHTSGAAAAVLSYIIISRLVEWGVGPGTMRALVEYLDRTVLVVMLVYFLVGVAYSIAREIKRNVGPK